MKTIFSEVTPKALYNKMHRAKAQGLTSADIAAWAAQCGIPYYSSKAGTKWEPYVEDRATRRPNPHGFQKSNPARPNVVGYPAMAAEAFDEWLDAWFARSKPSYSDLEMLVADLVARVERLERVRTEMADALA